MSTLGNGYLVVENGE